MESAASTKSADMQKDPSIEPLDIELHEIEYHEKVGSGFTADVYKGIFRNQTVAIKEIKSRRGVSAMDIKRRVSFMREVQVLSLVQHDHLVKFYGICFNGGSGRQRLITEFCHGGDLFGLLHEQDTLELIWAQKLKMCRDVAVAMRYLHAFNPQIMHRDLKSLNLLLERAVTCTVDVPHVKVSDFGLARMKVDDASADWGKMTADAGTCHWMAPEVPTGTYDASADVFSYAMVMFEVMCQEIPFCEVEGPEAVRMISQGIRPDLEAVPPDRPQVLEILMRACWSHVPERRPDFRRICEILDSVTLR